MDVQKLNEEKLREACCYGDNEALAALISRGTNINCKHDINGWTGLHWACKRGNVNTVRWLMANGADPKIENNQSQTPAQLTTNSQILQLLGTEGPVSEDASSSSDSLPITPSYLAHPPVDHKVSLDVRNPNEKLLTNGVHEGETFQSQTSHQVPHAPVLTQNTNQQASPIMSPSKEIVLKVRVAYSSDPDFIEVEFQPTHMNYSHLLITCCRELAINPQMVERIRKLPNTRLRNDKDVRRLCDYAELELVIKGQNRPAPSHSDSQSTSKNSYQSISSFKNQTILY
ncbi:ankyrin repeat domain-containing protein 40-like [Macrobrachium rosenbergii]|uniref:ankyrin repeat domain-containing protein 40-like n=1 Tax=Macrobrachium rosenbergii TaxID=79674 RepID=UPI0034D60E63